MAWEQARLAHVLVVDDETDLRELIASVLQDYGFAVVTAADGTAALERLTARAPAPLICLVLLDLMLPRRSGLSVLRALAQHGSNVPVVAMSGDWELLGTAQQNGATGMLRKPFSLADLLGTVERYCPRATA